MLNSSHRCSFIILQLTEGGGSTFKATHKEEEKKKEGEKIFSLQEAGVHVSRERISLKKEKQKICAPDAEKQLEKQHIEITFLL